MSLNNKCRLISSSKQYLFRIVHVRFRCTKSEKSQQINKINSTLESTVDVSEVKLHSKFSEKWWDKNGDLRALHSLNRLRVQFIRDGLQNMNLKTSNEALSLNGAKILDVGCGGGILTEALARIGANVTGVDASSELIETAKSHAALDHKISGRTNYICISIEDFIKSNHQTYDAVVASEILEHVNNKKLFLQNCSAALKTGGSIFITTLNKSFQSWLGGIIIAEYLLKLAPIGTHSWNKFITPIETQYLLKSCGCTTRLVHGMFYNPLQNEWIWSSSTAINYAIHAVKSSSNV
ncbi:ubiquinone biosynthesis O-methyltransferase, mitochondrial [Prorops nasuta]|uniref:ubiquinone biosynthesis O-methyltransferase, mitochondrial n=1 Tax=Prorops nasuta TaxID=863751 RepID=UPI0034CF3A2F